MVVFNPKLVGSFKRLLDLSWFGFFDKSNKSFSKLFYLFSSSCFGHKSVSSLLFQPILLLLPEGLAAVWWVLHWLCFLFVLCWLYFPRQCFALHHYLGHTEPPIWIICVSNFSYLCSCSFWNIYLRWILNSPSKNLPSKSSPCTQLGKHRILSSPVRKIR